MCYNVSIRCYNVSIRGGLCEKRSQTILCQTQLASQRTHCRTPLSQAGGTSVKAYLTESKTLHSSVRDNGKKSEKTALWAPACETGGGALGIKAGVLLHSFASVWIRYAHNIQRWHLHWRRLALPAGTMVEQSLRDCSPREGPVLEQWNSTARKSTGRKE